MAAEALRAPRVAPLKDSLAASMPKAAPAIEHRSPLIHDPREALSELSLRIERILAIYRTATTEVFDLWVEGDSGQDAERVACLLWAANEDLGQSLITMESIHRASGQAVLA